MNDIVSQRVRDDILAGLRADALAAEPLNALVVWTELGRGLAGMLDRKGGSESLLRETIEKWCTEQQAEEVDLAALIPRIAAERRLTREHLAAILQSLQARIEMLIADSAEQGVNDGGRTLWMAAVKGWFPAGLSILSDFPTLRGAPPARTLGALRAWSRRYFPQSTEDAKDLGIRAV